MVDIRKPAAWLLSGTGVGMPFDSSGPGVPVAPFGVGLVYHGHDGDGKRGWEAVLDTDEYQELMGMTMEYVRGHMDVKGYAGVVVSHVLAAVDGLWYAYGYTIGGDVCPALRQFAPRHGGVLVLPDRHGIQLAVETYLTAHYRGPLEAVAPHHPTQMRQPTTDECEGTSLRDADGRPL